MDLNTAELNTRLVADSSLPEEESSPPKSPDDITTQPIEIDPELDAEADKEFNRRLEEEIEKRSKAELPPIDVIDSLRASLPKENLVRKPLTGIQKAILRGQEYVNPFEMSDKKIKERIGRARSNLDLYHQIDPFERPETRFSSGKVLGSPDIDAQHGYTSA